MLQSPMSFHYVSTGEMNNFYRKLAQQRKDSIIEDRPMTLDVSFVLDILQYRVGLKLFVLHPNSHKVIDSHIVKKIIKSKWYLFFRHKCVSACCYLLDIYQHIRINDFPS